MGEAGLYANLANLSNFLAKCDNSLSEQANIPKFGRI